MASRASRPGSRPIARAPDHREGLRVAGHIGEVRGYSYTIAGVRRGPDCPSHPQSSCYATESLRVVEDGLNRAHVTDGVPIAPVETIVVMKLLAGRTQDLADIEAVIGSGADREFLRAEVQRAVPDRAVMLERLFENVDRDR